MSDFSRGALVRLRGDVPDLRVLGSSGPAAGPVVAVAWFAEDGTFRRAVLPVDRQGGNSADTLKRVRSDAEAATNETVLGLR